MKKFRVAKCIENGVFVEYAIFEDGSRKKAIENDEQYGKYFSVDNELNPNGGIFKNSFTDRVYDAVKTIRDGGGDCLRVFNLLGRHESVIYFLDRNIGEELRQKSIKAWENTEFGWSVLAGNKCSFSGYAQLNTDAECINIFTENRISITFKTEKEAKDYIESLVATAWKYSKHIEESLISVDNKDKLFIEMYENIAAETSKCNIVLDFIVDMINDDYKLKFDECKLDKMGYKVVQRVIK